MDATCSNVINMTNIQGKNINQIEVGDIDPE